MLQHNGKVLVLTFVVRRPSWLPDWNYWPLIPLLVLAAVAGWGFLWEASFRPLAAATQHYSQPAASQCDTDPKCTEGRSNQRIADYTLWLMIFTGILAVVSAAQFRFLIAADRRAAESSDLARQQFLLLGKQADGLDKQVDLMRQEYLAAHRPRIILRDVYFTKPKEYGSITFELSNSGDTGTTITGGFTRMYYVTDPREFKKTGIGDLTDRTGIKFAGGETIQFTEATPRDTLAAIVSGGGTLRLYFFGMLKYTNLRGEEYGTTREAVFRRVYHHGHSSFERTGNPDHEYSD